MLIAESLLHLWGPSRNMRIDVPISQPTPTGEHHHLPPAVRGLLSPSAYPHPASDIKLLETHISWIVLAGEYAYKLKKPLNLGFLDVSSFELRSINAERELALNRRLAPSIYLGIVDVVEHEGTIRIGGPGHVLERAVWMRRLPADGMLPELLAHDRVSVQSLRRLARRLVALHAVAPTGPGADEFGTPANIEANWRQSLEQVKPFVGETILDWQWAHIAWFVEATLTGRAAELERRVADGRVRDGHGDLHAGSLCLVDGEMVIFDCLDFSPAYRCADVAAEIAFLAMDLQRAGRADLGWEFITAYLRRSGDTGLLPLLDFYICSRAFVRGKVRSLRLAELDLDPAEHSTIQTDARAYFDLACAAAGAFPRPLLIATCGLPGSGKSTLARQIAERLGLVYLSTDVTRKRLVGMRPTQRGAAPFDSGLYGSEMTRRTYAALRQDALRWLRRGLSVVVDGTFTDPRQRRLMRDTAARGGARFLLVETTCDDAAIRSRIALRQQDPTRVSDADWDVYQRMRDAYMAPREIPADERLEDPSGGNGADGVITFLAGQA